MKPAITLSGAVTGATLVLMLSGCNAEPAVPEQLPFATPGANLTVTQSGTGCTPDGAYRANVAWQVADTLSSRLEIQVGSEGQVFARSNERSGNEVTGEWVSSGSVFLLLDRENDQLLAAIAAGPGDCAAPTP